MKKIRSFVSVLLALALVLSIAGSALAMNIGYIDTKKVYGEYKEYQTELKKLKDESKKKKDELEKFRKEAQEKLDKAIDEKKGDAEIKKLYEELYQSVNKKAEEFDLELQQMQASIMNKINPKILDATEKVAKKVGIDIVLDKTVIITGGVDVTNLVITELNK